MKLFITFMFPSLYSFFKIWNTLDCRKTLNMKYYKMFLMKEIFCVFVSGFSSKVLNHFTQFHFPANWSLSWSTQHISQRQCTVQGSFRSWKRYLDMKDMRTPSTYPLPLLMMPTTVYLFLWEHIKGPPESSCQIRRLSLCCVNFKAERWNLQNRELFIKSSHWSSAYIMNCD